MNIHRGTLPTAALIGVLLCVAGCTHTSTGAQPKPTSSSSSNPVLRAATPTPTPTKPALADLVVSPDSLGPLQIGQPVPDQSGPTSILKWNPAACPGTANGGNKGAWIPTYPPMSTGAIGNPDKSVFTFSTERKDSPLTFIALWSPELRTAKGVGVGSTAAQLKAAYGSALTFSHVNPTQPSDLYALQGTNSTLVFEVATKYVTYQSFTPWPKAALGTVVWMYLFAGHNSPTTLTGNVADGSCDTGE